MTGKPLLNWASAVADHDYKAATTYLSLLIAPGTAEVIQIKFKAADLTSRRANDILRACNRPALGMDDPGVCRDLKKVLSGEELSPVLIVSFADIGADIADGYHRVSLSYNLDPFELVPCKLAYLSKQK